MKQLSQILASVGKETILELVPGLGSIFLDYGGIETYEANSFICKEGEEIFKLLIPIDGPLKLVRSTDEGQKFIGYLQKGRTLALNEIIEGGKAGYSAIAERSTKVATIPVFKFRDYLQKNPKIFDYLKIMTTSAAGRSFKRYLEGHNLQKTELVELASQISLKFREYQAGQAVELTSPQLFLVDSGSVRITQSGSSSEISTLLTEGAWFGGVSMEAPHIYPYTCTIVEPAKIRTLDLTREITSEFERLQLVESLHDEPWIQFTNKNGTTDNTISPQPGIRLGLPDLIKLGVKFNPEDLHFSSSDHGSIVASIKNVAEIHRTPYNRHNISVEAGQFPILSPLKVATILEAYGLVGMALKTKFEDLARQEMPLLTVYGSRYVAVLNATKNYVIIADPCVGFVLVDKLDFESRWNGQVIEVQPDELATIRVNTTSDEGKPESELLKGLMRKTRQAIVRVALKQKSMLTNIVVLNIILLLIGAIGPKITEKIVDDVLSLRDWNAVVTLTVATVLVMFTTLIISVLQTAARIEYTHRLNQRIFDLFYRHYLRIKTSDHSKNRVGDFGAQFSEINTLKSFFTTAPIQIGMQLASIILYSFLLMQYDTQLALMAFGLLPIIVAIRFVHLARVKQNYEKQYEVGKEGGSLITEAVSGIATIKSLNAEDIVRKKLEKNNVAGGILERQVEMEGVTINGFVTILTTAVSTAAMWISLKLASRGEISIGEVVAINAYFGSLAGPIIGLAGFFTQIEQIKVSWKRVAETLAKPPGESELKSVANQSVILKGKIKVEGLSFRYDADAPWVLKDIDFVIYPGQTVAIVGRSGCGKSTLANIIANNLTATIGRVFFDGYESNQLSASSKRSQIGVVLQENELFEGTIAANIAYSDDAPLDTDVVHAAVGSGASEFIDGLPGQYNYYLGEGGNGLSGGQRQRVSIARTLFKNPRILIMDEATSALDSESENLIMRNMNPITRDRTSLIIAHRLSTIRHADRILVMKDGAIVEDGSHSTLLAKQGYYSELFVDQISSGVA